MVSTLRNVPALFCGGRPGNSRAFLIFLCMLYYLNMEMIDVLNEDGSMAGRAVSKEDVHEKGLWHRVVHVWVINNKNEILVQLKAPRITGESGVHDISVAGHVSQGETSLQGAVREFEEELGLRVKEEDLVKIGEVKQDGYRTLKSQNKEWNDVYVYKTNLQVTDFFPNPDEVESVKYISTEDFKKWFYGTIKEMVIHPEEFRLLSDFLKII